LKERDCSLRLDVGEQSGSERKALSLLFALAGGGATRSAESRRMNTAEINAAGMNNRLLN